MLSKSDFVTASQILDCSPAAIAAVTKVETSGAGFLPDGRPNILFEAKTFHRLTHGQFDESHPNLSSPIWDHTLYGASGAHQWDRLTAAMDIDRLAALQSASWGLFQIMGENYHRCGFQSVDGFVGAMRAGETSQLTAFCKFVAADPHMLAALRGKDWPTFARFYNGRQFQQNQYDTKLAAAFDAVQTTLA